MSGPGEGYAPGFGADVRAMLERRSAASCAGFLLRRLRPGMHVLDAGCGPGTISAGLARALGPGGSVVGVDAEPSQVELAQRLARATSVAGLSFACASVEALPFAGGSFDAALAHALLEHLARPQDALAELRRVLRAGGLLVAASSDWSGAVVEPAGADVALALQGHAALRRRAGGDPDLGRRLPVLVREAGFELVQETVQWRADLAYPELAGYVARRLEAAGEAALAGSAAAARRWADAGGEGRFEQRWVCVVGRRAGGVGYA